MRFFKILAALACLMTAGALRAQEPDFMFVLFDCTGDVCIIKENHGGVVFMFEEAAKQALKRNMKIRVVGQCASACVIFASKTRKNVCIGPNVRMGLHYGTTRHVYTPMGAELEPTSLEKLELYLDPPAGYRVEYLYEEVDYGSDINTWAFRENKMFYGEPYYLTYKEALKFWRPCTKDELKK